MSVCVYLTSNSCNKNEREPSNVTIPPVNQVTVRGEIGRGIRSTREIEFRKLHPPSSPTSLPRAIKRPGRGYTEGKLQDGMVVVVVVLRCRGNSVVEMAPVYPSIHVDPRIKESTSCKTASRYYEGRTAVVRGAVILADVMPSNSLFATSPPPFFTYFSPLSSHLSLPLFFSLSRPRPSRFLFRCVFPRRRQR